MTAAADLPPEKRSVFWNVSALTTASEFRRSCNRAGTGAAAKSESADGVIVASRKLGELFPDPILILVRRNLTRCDGVIYWT